MQQEMLVCMAEPGTVYDLARKNDAVRAIHRNFVNGLSSAEAKDLVIHRRISRLTYAHHCLEGSAVQAYRDRGIEIAPGMKIGYIVRDARRYAVDTEWDAAIFDLPYYHSLLEKASEEIAFAFRTPLLSGDPVKAGIY